MTFLRHRQLTVELKKVLVYNRNYKFVKWTVTCSSTFKAHDIPRGWVKTNLNLIATATRQNWCVKGQVEC